MIYVGVDIAKNTHYACVMRDTKTVLTPPFAFQNDENGFAKFLDSFKKHPKKSVIVGLESTSIYGENLIAFLAEKGYSIALINPIETAVSRKRKIRNTKTDKIDCKVICNYLATEEYRLMQPKELELLNLRGLCRFRQTLKKSNARLKTQLVSYLDVCFPEFFKVFSSVHGKGAYAVLSEYPSAQDVEKANITKLSNILSSASRGKLGRFKAEQLKHLAKHSVAAKNSDMSFQLKNTIGQIRLIEIQLKNVEAAITKAFKDIGSVIGTIPVSVQSMAQ